MRSGDLDRSIIIQEPVRTKNPIGEYEVVWTDVITDLPCNYQGLIGRENYEASQLVAGADSRFKVRYRTDIFPRMRVIFESEIYDIQSVSEGAGRRIYTEIFARRKDNERMAASGS